MLYCRASTNQKAPDSTFGMKHCCKIPTWREHRTGAKPSPGPRPLPRNNSSYHPDNPRRHESQLSTALVLCLRCVLFRVQSSATHQLRTHRKQHHLHLPIQRTSLSWVDWKKDSPTMRQHSSKQIDVHPAYCYILHNKSPHP